LDWGSRTKSFTEFNSSCQSACCFNGKFSPDIEDVKAGMEFCVIELLKLQSGWRITEEMICKLLLKYIFLVVLSWNFDEL
jgi:hypothetical protein